MKMYQFSIAVILLQCAVVYSITDVYKIPTPEFFVYPNNLQINLPDENGIELFYFYGRVTKKNGQVLKILLDTKEKTNGAWMLFDYNITLDVGDSITYWLYVKKDGVGYRMPYGIYHVNYVIGYMTTTTEYYPYTTPFLEKSDNPTPVNIRDPVNLDGVREVENVECKVSCEHQLKNMTDMVTVMELHIESLENMVMKLLENSKQQPTNISKT